MTDKNTVNIDKEQLEKAIKNAMNDLDIYRFKESIRFAILCGGDIEVQVVITTVEDEFIGSTLF